MTTWILLALLLGAGNSRADEQCMVVSANNNTQLTLPLAVDNAASVLLGTDIDYPRRGSQCLRLHNSGEQPLELTLLLDNPRIAHAELSTCDDGGTTLLSVAGIAYPLTHWQGLGGELFFPVTLAAGTTSCLRITVGSHYPYNSHIQLQEAKKQLLALAERHVLTGLLGGLIAALVLYSLLLGISNREATYIYLAGSAAFVALMHCNDLGVLYPLWPQQVYWNTVFSPMCAVPSTLFGVALLRRYMLLPDIMPRTDRALHWYIWYLLAVCLPLAALQQLNLMILLYGVPAVALMPLLIVISVLRLRQGYQPARLYLIAILLPVGAGIVTYLDYTGIKTTSPFSRLAPLLATALQLILFALALGERINWLRGEQKQIQQQRLLAETETQAKKNFLAQISHELRTPLSGILGLLNVVERKSLPNSDQILFDGIVQSARYLLDTTNALLDHARIDAGKWTFDHRPFDLHALLQDCLATHREAAASKQLNLSCHIHENVPQHLLGDAAALGKIFHYIIDNAIKFTHNGGIVLLAETLQADEKKLLLRFDVLDTGIGFDQLFKSKAFELFELADQSGTRQQQGLGLGLSLSSKLCQLLGGEIGCDSTPGHGTVFWLRIPFTPLPVTSHQTTGRHAAPPPASAAAPATRPDRAKRNQVLVAEDDEALRMVVAAQLQTLDWQHQLYDDGLPLFIAYQQQHASTACLLLDWNMPVYNAQTTIEAVRQFEREHQLPAVPIIIMSAYDPQAIRALSLPADVSVLHKPVTAHALRSSLLTATLRSA